MTFMLGMGIVLGSATLFADKPLARISHHDSGRTGLYRLPKNCLRRTTTLAPKAPPLLNQEGSC
jgi:hypothetical protein